jgi:hypothetical protein
MQVVSAKTYLRSLLGATLAAMLASLGLAPALANDEEELCNRKLGLYIRFLDKMLEEDAQPQPRYSLLPYVSLHDSIRELKGCTIETVKTEVAKSRYAKPPYNPVREDWVFVLSNRRIEVQFSYRADEKRSELHSAGWVEKFP